MGEKVIRKLIIVFILLSFLNVSISFIFPLSIKAQETTWAKIYGGPEADVATSVIKTSDGNYLIAGNSNTIFEGNHYALAVIKVDRFGNIIWCKKYGGENSPHEEPPFYYKSDIVETKNHEYVIVNGPSILRLDKDGELLWAKYFGRYQRDYVGFEFTSIQELDNSDFIVSGNAIGGGEDSSMTAMAARLDKSGNIKWIKRYPGYGENYARESYSKIIALGSSGFILGCSSSFAEFEAYSYSTEILRLDSNGNIIWAKSYKEKNQTDSTFFALSSLKDNGFIISCESERNGSLIFKTNLSGDVIWSNLFTSYASHYAAGGDTNILAIQPLQNGNVALVGSSTEFADEWCSDFNAISAIINGNGDFLSISVLGSDSNQLKPNILPNSLPAKEVALSVTEGDNGGIVYAGVVDSFTSSNDFFVVKMDAGGGVSKVGDFLRFTDPGDEKEVFIEPREILVKDFEKKTKPISDCNMYDAGFKSIEGDFSEKTLEGTSSEKLILEPLYPDSETEPSTVMQGGVVYRYFTLKKQSGEKVTNAEIKYNGPLTNESEIIKSDANGEVALKFLSGTKTNYGTYNVNCKIKSVKVQDVKYILVEDPSFSVEVTPLTYSTNWLAGNGSSAKVGLGIILAGLFATAEQEGGMVISRTKEDPDKSNKDSLGVNNNFATTIGIGLEGGFEFKGKLGPATAKGLDASAKISGGVFNEFTTLFNSPDNSSTTEKLMEGLSILTGIANCITSGGTQIMNMVINSVMAVLSSRVEVKEVITGIKFAFDGSVSGLKIGVEAEDASGNKSSLSGLGLGNLNGSITGTISINNYPINNEVGVKVGLVFSAGVSLAGALGYSVGEVGIDKEISLELICDSTNLDFKKAVLSFSKPPDSHGEVQQINLIVDRNLLGNAAQQIEQFVKLTDFSSQNVDADLILDDQFLAEILASVINLIQKVEIPYEKVVVMDSKPSSIDLSLGLDIGGWQLELGVKPTFGQYESFTYEEGIFIPIDKNLKLGRLVKYNTYADGLYSAHVDSLSNIAGKFLSAIGDAITGAWNVLSTTISGLADTVVSIGAKIGDTIVGGAEIIFDKGTNFLSSTESLPRLASLSALAKTTKTVTTASTVPKNNPFIVGGYYLMEPYNAKLSKPATLTLSYIENEIKNRDQGKFAIYKFNGEINAWEIVKSEQDIKNHKLVSEINNLGEYCIGYDITPPDFQLLDYGSNGIIHIDKPEIYIKCTDVGSGIDPKSISSEIDGQKIDLKYNAVLNQALLNITTSLSQGTHEIKITGKDTSGNSNSRTFQIGIQIPPSQLTLELGSTGESFIELNFSSPQKGTLPLKNILLKRAEPYNGKIFHTIATLDSNVTSFRDESVNPGITYAYNAMAVDTGGNQSVYSNILYVSIKGTNLSAPESLNASALESSIVLNWKYSQSKDNLGGFKVFRSISEGKDIVEIATAASDTMTYEDKDVERDKTYCYLIKAVDSSDSSLLSKPSNTVCIDFGKTSGRFNFKLFIILFGIIAIITVVLLFILRRKTMH